MDQFPCMLYRFPAIARDSVRLQDGAYDTRTVADQAELKAARAEGWHDSAADAKAEGDAAAAAAAEKATAEAEAKKLEDAKALLASAQTPATRAELEQKAIELAISFTPKWSDKKLADAIATALEA